MRGEPGDPSGARDPSARRVARNTVLPMLAEVVGKLAPLVLFALIARMLGTSALGDYVLAFAVTSLIFPVATFGMDRFLVREVARERGAIDRLFFDLVTLKAAIGVVGVAIAVAAFTLLGYPARVQELTVLLGFATVLNIVGLSAVGVFQAHERMEFQVYATLPQKYLTAAFGIGVLVLGGGIVEVALAVLAAAVLSLFLSLFLQFRFFRRPRLTVRPRAWPGILGEAMPFGLQELFAQLHFRADIVLLSLLTSSAAVGWYGASFRLVEATLFVSWSVASAMMPMYSYLDERSRPSLRVAYEKSVKFLLALTVPIAVTLLAAAPSLIALVYGDRYGPSVGALQLLAPAIVFYAVSHLTGAFVLARGRGTPFVWATAAAAALNIALNLALIPRLSVAGAAAATLVSEAVLALVGLLLAVRVAGSVPWLAAAAGPLVAGTGMVATMLALGDRLLLALPAGVLVYLGLLAAFELRRFREDAEVVRSILRRPTGSASGR